MLKQQSLQDQIKPIRGACTLLINAILLAQDYKHVKLKVTLLEGEDK